MMRLLKLLVIKLKSSEYIHTVYTENSYISFKLNLRQGCDHLKKLITILLMISCMLICFYFYQHRDNLNVFAYFSEDTKAKETSADNETKQLYTIVIDPGHGGYDSGAVSKYGEYEKDVTLSIAQKLQTMFNDDESIQVILTRENDEVNTSDNQEDLAQRVSLAEALNADFFLSLHINFSSYDDGACGIETYVDEDDETALAFAKTIQNNLTIDTSLYDRGLRDNEDANLYVISKNSISSILVELGFFSDEDDTSYLMSENGQNEIAQSLYNSIQTQYTQIIS